MSAWSHQNLCESESWQSVTRWRCN